MLSNIIGFFASQSSAPVDWYTLAKGTAIEGGYFAGIVTQDDGDYAVIVAPKSSETSLAVDTTGTSNPSTTSTYDGLSNTLAMDVNNYAAARYCLSYSNDGYSDWYLPAKHELEVCYRYLKPGTASNQTSSGANPRSVPTTSNYTSSDPAQTISALFQDGAEQAFSSQIVFYNTSTQTSSTQNSVQRFYDGSQTAGNKTTQFLVRPVRRVKI